jgi:ankyrin repeat protein
MTVPSLLFDHPPGNTPLHLAMDSGHAEVAVMLIEAGADRSRVSHLFCSTYFPRRRITIMSDPGKSG